MSTQITVRLPDDQVDFLDAEVSAGHAPSRAAAIARALRREQRRRRAEQDLETVLAAGKDPELTALQDWAGHRTYPDLD
jgi:Arc/MetJ-type ribon-helix-helix transcriptional regulator